MHILNTLCKQTLYRAFKLRFSVISTNLITQELGKSRIYTGDFSATRFEDFLRVKIAFEEWLLTRDETRLPRSHLARIAAV